MTWAYLTEKKQRIEVSSRELKALAKSGTIHKMTYVFTPEGRCARAGKIRGLHFPKPKGSLLENNARVDEFVNAMKKIEEDVKQEFHQEPPHPTPPPPTQPPPPMPQPLSDAGKKNHTWLTIITIMIFSTILISVGVFFYISTQNTAIQKDRLAMEKKEKEDKLAMEKEREATKRKEIEAMIKHEETEILRLQGREMLEREQLKSVETTVRETVQKEIDAEDKRLLEKENRQNQKYQQRQIIINQIASLEGEYWRLQVELINTPPARENAIRRINKRLAELEGAILEGNNMLKNTPIF